MLDKPFARLRKSVKQTITDIVTSSGGRLNTIANVRRTLSNPLAPKFLSFGRLVPEDRDSRTIRHFAMGIEVDTEN